MGYKSVTAAVLAAGFLFANISPVLAKEDKSVRVQTIPVSKGIESNEDKPKVGKLLLPKKEEKKVSKKEMERRLKQERKLREERAEKAEKARKEQEKHEKKQAEKRREEAEKREELRREEERRAKKHKSDKKAHDDKRHEAALPKKPVAGTARFMADNQAVVKNSASKVVEYKDKLYFKGIQLPDDYQNISIYGEAEATKGQAVRLIKEKNPNVHLMCSVEELVDLYWIEAEREGVRPDLALAQSLVETGFYRYGGDVDHDQNNFCCLGTTVGGVKGAAFKTPEISFGIYAKISS